MSMKKKPTSTKFIPKFKLHPDNIPALADVNSIIPDHVRALIGDIFVEWGRVDMAVILLADEFGFGENSPGLAALSKMSRFDIIRKIVRFERDVMKAEESYFRLLLLDSILAPRVRHTIAHGLTLGTTNLDGGSLFVMKIDQGGEMGYHSIPYSALEKALSLMRTVCVNIAEYAKACSSFLDQNSEIEAVAKPASE